VSEAGPIWGWFASSSNPPPVPPGGPSMPFQLSATFARLSVRGSDLVVVDIAIDVPPRHPPVVSIAGPTLDPEELAGRELVALFDRAEARDFADVFVLARRFGRSTLLVRTRHGRAGSTWRWSTALACRRRPSRHVKFGSGSVRSAPARDRPTSG
jgi:hypothetical protein